MVIGGALGYILGSNATKTQQDKENTIREIIEYQQQKNDVDGEYTQVESEENGIMSSNELVNYQYNKYPFEGKWANFVGQPSINFHAMIYGRPKQGKSILAVQFAQYLSENFGRVLYVASEEGFSVTLQNKVSEFAHNNPNLDFANYRDFEQIRNALIKRKYKFVFIDSVNFIKITPEDVEDIKHDNRKTAFITIQQATKNGNFRGSQEFAHNFDIIIRVESGMAIQQGRFQEPTEMPIFDKPEQNAIAPLQPPQMGANKPQQMDLFSSVNSGEAEF